MNKKNVLALKISRPNKNNDFPYGSNNSELAFSFGQSAPPPPDANMGI